MQKTFIQNRQEQIISVVVDRCEGQKGLAFVMHGLGGFKEQEHLTTFGQAFKDRSYTVVYFDTTNTLGESGGTFEEATITSYYADLEDVIAWAEGQKWYQVPFALTGHSLGGICIALYAQKHPDNVLALAPISTVVSGKLSVEAHEQDDPQEFTAWKKTGWRTEESLSKPGVMKRLPWTHIEDRLKYDLVPEAYKLTMPVLLIVGEQDDSTPPRHVKTLYKSLPGPKEFHVIRNAPHTFRDPQHLSEIKAFFLKWIDTCIISPQKKRPIS